MASSVPDWPGLANTAHEPKPARRARNGGEAGIRTLGTLAGSPVFETGPGYAKTPNPGGFRAMVGNPYHLWYHLSLGFGEGGLAPNLGEPRRIGLVWRKLA